MSNRDTLSFPKAGVKFDTLTAQLRDSAKQPPIGVTQGGSSRKNAGCRSAATDGAWRPQKIK